MPITEQGVEFLFQNKMHNDAEWHKTHKREYEELVRAPLLALSAELGPTMERIDPQLVTDPGKTISRVRRDTRFTKDKALYRDNMWLVFHRGKGMLWPTWFFEFSPQGYAWGVGYWKTPVPVRNKVAEWVLAGDKRYKAAQRALDKLPHCALDGECFKRTKYPDAAPPHSSWLERKELSVSHSGKDPEVLFSEGLGEKLATEFVALRPVYELMADAHLAVADQIPPPRQRW